MNHEAISRAGATSDPRPTVLMLLTNAYDPDPRVRQESLGLIGMGCRVHLLAWDRDLKSPQLECIEGIEVERVFLRSVHGRGASQLFFYAGLYLKLLWRGWRSSFDVVHCHDLDTLPLGFVLGKLKRKPVVYDAHESFTDMLDGRVHKRLLRALVWLENVLIRRADLLITVGEKLRRHFSDRGARHSVVVGNWKRLEDYRSGEEQNQQVRRRLGVPENALLVVCITHLLRDRKIEELLEAIAESPDVYLLIGGKGVLEDLVKRRAAENPRIRFTGFVQAADIPAYTCAGDVVYYGFDPQNPNARFSAPNKLFEALAAGKPLITGDFGEIADVVRQGSCGIVLPEYSPSAIRDALSRLQDSQLRRSLAGNASRLGRAGMNWEKGKEVLYQEYSALLPGLLRGPREDDGVGHRESRSRLRTSRPVRILHVVDNLGMGGLQNGLANLADRMDPTRFEHIFCAMRPVEDVHAQPFPAGRTQKMCLSPKEARSRIQVAALTRKIRSVRPDIVHSRNWAAIEAVIAAKWIGSCAVVHSEHGIDSDTADREPWRRGCFRRLAFEMADRVLSVSRHLRDLHAERTGFPAQKIRVIHNGVDTHRFFPDPEARAHVREELGLSGDEFCIGCVGNLTPVKDHLTVLKAVERVDQRCGNWRLLIIGDGPKLPELTAFVQHRQWNSRVLFLGRSQRVPQLLNAMDVYILSSVTEGICNSLLEAMATALPVLATATGGNPEVVIDSESGLLFPVGDFGRLAEHLLLLQAQRDFSRQLGEKAVRRVRQEFSIDSMVNNYEQLYESLAPGMAAPLRAAVGF